MTNRYIPYGCHAISETDIDAVVKALRSSLITQGPLVADFEAALCQYTNAKYAVVANSATSALHVACLALDLSAADWLWTSPNTFVASANCGRYCGANVDFVDIDAQTYNISVEKLALKLRHAQAENRLPKILVVVHFAGQICDMKAIRELSRNYGFAIIEDASHAIGASYHGQLIGNCQYSDICVFSFHPVKIITCAEGGAAMTQSLVLAQKMRSLTNQGIQRQTEDFLTQAPGDWYYEQQELGFNYRMTEMQAALGLSQLKRIDAFLAHRWQAFDHYQVLLADLPFILPYQDPQQRSSLHLFPILVPPEWINYKRDIFHFLRQNGIGTQVHYIPVHTQPYYQNLGFAWGDFPQAEDYYARTLSLPLFATITLEQQQIVAQRLAQAIDACIPESKRSLGAVRLNTVGQ